MNALAMGLMFFLFYLHVSMELEFQTSPQPIVNGEEGSSTILTCIVSDLEENQNITWKVNKQLITNGSRIINDELKKKYTVNAHINDRHHTYNLVVNKIERIDAYKEYYCAVTTNKNMEVLSSNPAKINVSQVPDKQYPECYNRNAKTRLKESDKLYIICQSEKSQPIPKLQWNREDNRLMTKEEKYYDEVRIIYNKTLTHTDNGAVFWCQLKLPNNPLINRNCSIGPIQVDYKPRVNLSTPKYNLNEEALFVCFSLSSPQTVTYNWTITPPIPQYIIENNGRVLRLLKVGKQYEGTVITCHVHNDIGYGSDKAIISIDDVDDDNSFVEDLPDQTRKTNNLNKEYPELPTATILSVSGASLLLLSLIMAILLCYFQVYTRSHALDYTGQRIPQPDVYFEPKDNVHSPFANEATPWKRSVGVQVCGDSSESSYTYAEIEERMKQTLSV